MNAADLIRLLERLSNLERLAVIEAATRLIRDDLTAQALLIGGDDPILVVAGCLSGNPLSGPEIEMELYGEKQQRPQFGSARGLITISVDFDEPLEEFSDCRP